MSFYSPV